MADTQLLEIIVIAAIAAVVLFRLYSVLGRRTGHENPPASYRDNFPGLGETVGTGETAPAAVVTAPERPTDPVSSGLFDISLADRSFDRDRFLSGARSAYEMIETAYAGGDRQTLRNLLAREVYDAFTAAMDARDRQGQTCRFTFVGFTDVKIVGAALKRRIAEITVSFKAEVISSLLDAAGRLVSGDEKEVLEVKDIWTFARDTSTRNPNWQLVTTAAEA